MNQTILIVVSAAASLLGLGVLVTVFLVLRDRAGARRRIEGLFRRPPKPAKTPGAGHYYRPYWS